MRARCRNATPATANPIAPVKTTVDPKPAQASRACGEQSCGTRIGSSEYIAATPNLRTRPPDSRGKP